MSKVNYNRIKELLAKYGRSNIELAAFLDVTEQTVSTWCTNANQPPLPTLFRVSDFLDIEPGELLTAKKDLKTVPNKGRKKK